MTILLNGKPENVPDSTTIRSLIELKGLGGHAVAVEVNQRLVPHTHHTQHTLREGDRIELVSLVGGG